MAAPLDRLPGLWRPFRDARCLPEIRRWLRAHVDDDEVGPDAELVATELVTNVVEHTHNGEGVVRIQLDAHDDRVDVRIEVDDHDPDATLIVGRSRLGKHRGRGLQIVDSLAAWGVVSNGRGKTVWARLRFLPLVTALMPS